MLFEAVKGKLTTDSNDDESSADNDYNDYDNITHPGFRNASTDFRANDDDNITKETVLKKVFRIAIPAVLGTALLAIVTFLACLSANWADRFCWKYSEWLVVNHISFERNYRFNYVFKLVLGRLYETSLLCFY